MEGLLRLPNGRVPDAGVEPAKRRGPGPGPRSRFSRRPPCAADAAFDDTGQARPPAADCYYSLALIARTVASRSSLRKTALLPHYHSRSLGISLPVAPFFGPAQGAMAMDDNPGA